MSWTRPYGRTSTVRVSGKPVSPYQNTRTTTTVRTTRKSLRIERGDLREGDVVDATEPPTRTASASRPHLQPIPTPWDEDAESLPDSQASLLMKSRFLPKTVAAVVVGWRPAESPSRPSSRISSRTVSRPTSRGSPSSRRVGARAQGEAGEDAGVRADGLPALPPQAQGPSQRSTHP